MKIRKEMVWHKGENPKKNGVYLLAMLWTDGTCYNALSVDYTTALGWNTSSASSTNGWGQNPNDGAYAWAELPF